MELADANRERRLPMINHTSHSSHALIRSIPLRYTMGMCLALLAWCPSSRAQANNPAPASAEEVKQLREYTSNQAILARSKGLRTGMIEGGPQLRHGVNEATRKIARLHFLFIDLPCFLAGSAAWFFHR